MTSFQATAAPVHHIDSDADKRFDFWGVLNRRKWIVFLGLVAGLLLATLYYFQTATIYESTARLSIQPKNQNFVRFSKINMTSMLPDSEQILPTRHDKYFQRELIKSCVETYEVFKREQFITKSLDETIDSVLGNLDVQPDKDDPWLYTLKFRSLNPIDSQQILNNVKETYRDYLTKLFKGENEEMINLLKDHKLKYEERLRQIEDEIVKLGNLDLITQLDKFGHDIHNQSIATLQPRLSELRDKLAALVASRDRCTTALAAGPEAMEVEVWKLEQDKVVFIKDKKIDLPTANGYEWLLSRITEAEVELKNRRLRLGAGHKSVLEAEQALEHYRQEYARRVSEEEKPVVEEQIPPQTILERCIAKFDNQIELLQQAIEETMRELNFHTGKAAELAELRQKRAKLEENRNYYRETLDETLKQILQINPRNEDLNSDKMASEGFIFMDLEMPKKGERVWPILPLVLAIGGLLGSLLGFGLGCVVDLADKTFHNPDEVIRSLNLPLIGHIPVISQGKRYQLENSPIEPVICTHHRPKSQVAEAFRAVRTALFFNAQGSKSQVIQVTSPTPGDGKSTAAANLAVSIAQSGKRVLLVDADMRRPRVGAIFGVTAKEGFATVLSGDSFWKDVVVDVEDIEGLSVMPCGMKPSNPAELATSPQVKQLIEQMRAEFDFVIIDTPPLLAVTDPCPIAVRVDGVVMCMRIKKNVRISAERSVEILRNLGANIVGVVVNGVGAQSGYGSQYTYGAYRAGYSYNGYGYGYGYGNYYDEKNNASTPRPSATPVKRLESSVAATDSDSIEY